MDVAQRTVDIARQNVVEGGRAFATVIAMDGEVIAENPDWERLKPTIRPA